MCRECTKGEFTGIVAGLPPIRSECCRFHGDDKYPYAEGRLTTGAVRMSDWKIAPSIVLRASVFTWFSLEILTPESLCFCGNKSGRTGGN